MAKTPEDVRIQSWKNLIPEGDENPFKPGDPKYDLTIEEWGQTEYDSGKKVGEKQARAQLLQRIMEIAGKSFTEGKDEHAYTLRQLHKQLKDEDSK